MPFEFPSDPSDIDNVIIQSGEGNLSMVQRVLPSLGLTYSDENGYSCLHAAAAYSQLPVLQWLLESGIDPNLPDADGDTPLHHCDGVEAARVLVAYGADVNLRNKEGRTPLGRANAEVVREGDEDYDEEDVENNKMKEVVAYLRTFVGPGNQEEILEGTKEGEEEDDDDEMDDDA